MKTYKIISPRKYANLKITTDRNVDDVKKVLVKGCKSVEIIPKKEAKND